MNDHILEKVIGIYGIFKFTILESYNVVNLKTTEIIPIMNIICLKDAEEYVNKL